MNIVLCVDKNNGMMFNNRRLSRDEKVISKIIEICNGNELYTSSYSSELFQDYENLISSDIQASSNAFYFIEDGEIPDGNIESFYIFNWNRNYPSDKKFTYDLKLNGYKRVKKEEFDGNSHKKITLEVYKKEKTK